MGVKKEFWSNSPFFAVLARGFCGPKIVEVLYRQVYQSKSGDKKIAIYTVNGKLPFAVSE